jgi:outer membrane protein OmpA-like peptidoglycan-associated protein
MSISITNPFFSMPDPKNTPKRFTALILHIFLIQALLLCFCKPIQTQSLFDSLYDVRTLEIHFASGKATLSASSIQALDSLLNSFQGGEKTVRITAHTDSDGNQTFNEQLSAQRAESVSKWLLSNGLPEKSIISVSALGERAPVRSNDTEAGKFQNRRATIELARRVPMALLEGRVTDKSTGQGIETTVSFRSKTRQDSARTDSSGRYSVRLPKDSVVKIEVVKKDYFFESVTMKIMGSPELYKRYKISPDIALPPAKPGEKAVLKDLFFVGDQAVLLKASEPQLPIILKFMQLNPELVIEIGGHVNVPIPFPEDQKFKLLPGQTAAEYMMSRQDPWKQMLSEKRAETILQYLIKNGIEASRMTAKGYKNGQMLFPYAREESQQQMNRRVEITVTGRTGH